MVRTDKVTISIEEGKSLFNGGLQYEVGRAMSEYIDRQHEHALSLFHQGKVSEARDIMRNLDLLMTFKVQYVEVKN